MDSNLPVDGNSQQGNCDQHSDTEDPDHTSELFVSKSDSFLNTSVHMHDYCGAIDCETISIDNNKSTQTFSQCMTQKQDASTQCDLSFVTKCSDCSTCSPINKVKTFDCATQVNSPVLTIEDIEKDDQKLLFYTGIPNSATYNALFDEIQEDATRQTARYGASTEKGRPRHLRLVDEFFMVLMRLRLGLLLEDLADRFNTGTSICAMICNRWVDFLYI